MINLELSRNKLLSGYGRFHNPEAEVVPRALARLESSRAPELVPLPVD